MPSYDAGIILPAAYFLLNDARQRHVEMHRRGEIGDQNYLRHGIAYALIPPAWFVHRLFRRMI